jgi:peptidoglycan/xylan/chitin deacetylase (PgdA/CDA1 family)
MHPTKATLEALDEMILYVKSQGYTVKTVGAQLK